MHSDLSPFQLCRSPFFFPTISLPGLCCQPLKAPGLIIPDVTLPGGNHEQNTPRPPRHKMLKKKHNWDRGKTTCHSPITLYQSGLYLLKQCSDEPLKVGLSSTSKNHPYTQPQRSTRSTRSIQDYTKTIETRLKAVRDAPNDNSFEWNQIRRFLSMRLFPLPLWQPP